MNSHLVYKVININLPMFVFQQAVQILLPRNAVHSPLPTNIQCPYCNQVGITQIKNKVGSGTLCCALILLATACCFIPFVSNKCQDKRHNCPHCQAKIGLHEYKVF